MPTISQRRLDYAHGKRPRVRAEVIREWARMKPGIGITLLVRPDDKYEVAKLSVLNPWCTLHFDGLIRDGTKAGRLLFDSSDEACEYVQTVTGLNLICSPRIIYEQSQR